MFGLKFSGLNPSLNLTVDTSIKDSEGLSERVGEFVTHIVNGTPLSDTFGIDSLVLGASSADSIAAFSKIRLDVPLNPIVNPLHDEFVKLKSSSIISLLSPLDLKTGPVKIGAAVDRAALLDAAVSFNNAWPVRLRGLGYIGLSLGLDDTSITSIEIPGLAISQGINQLDLKVRAHFPSSEEIKKKVGVFSQDLMDHFGNTMQSISVSRLVFGPSSQVSFKFLSRGLLKIASSYIFSKEALDYFKKALSPLSQISIQDAIALHGLSLAFSPSKIISAGIKGLTKTNISVAVDLPFVGINTALDSTPAFDIQVSPVIVSGSGPVDLNTQVSVHDSDELATKIDSVVDHLLQKVDQSGKIGFSNLIFGQSSTDSIDAFSQINLAFNIDSLLSPIKNSQFNSSSLLKKIDLTFGGIEAQMKPNRIVDVNLNGKLNNGFSVNLTGLGYYSLNAGLDDVGILSVSGSAPDVYPGQNELNVNANVNFPSKPEIRSKVGHFVNDLIQKGLGSSKDNVTADTLLFGATQESSFKFLSRVRLSLPSSSILKPSLLSNSSGINFNVQKVAIDGTHSQSQSLHVDLDALIKNVGFNVGLDVPYASVQLGLNHNL